MRKNCPENISLVAEINEKFVGHILFTPVTINSNQNELKGMGLAPISVFPEFQNKGIGSKLISFGLELVKNNNYSFVALLEHPEYYPRFGFKRASAYNIISENKDVPDEAFMILVYDEPALKNISGVAYFIKEFLSTVKKKL